MSTSIALGGGRSVRTIEHLMAALSAFAIDNVEVRLEGSEIPIFDGSARAWCRALAEAGTVALTAPRRVVRIRKPIQVAAEGGFLRAEPAAGFAIDLTYNLLRRWPVMRWAGSVEREVFVSELAASRSFGRLKLDRWFGRTPAPRENPAGPVVANARRSDLVDSEPQDVWHALSADKDLWRPEREPLLRGARPWRAAFVVGRSVIGGARYPDEAVRHVALDMIGDLALAGHPFEGRIVAHNPSHEKTYAFVAALMRDRSAWEWA